MISAAVGFALLSLSLSGINDVLFKRYNRRERSRGMLIFGIGIVWGTLQLTDALISGATPEFNRASWLYGIAAGICVAAANIGLLEGLRHMDVSLGSTIYRLNTIGVVILSALLLGESMTLIKGTGIALGVIAVLILHRPPVDPEFRKMINVGLLVMVGAALLRAAYGVISKAGLNSGADPAALILLSALCWIVSGLGYAVIIEKSHRVTVEKVFYACVSGALVYGIVRTLVAALSLGEANVVIPIANMSFLMALTVAILFKMEKLDARKAVAMGAAVVAITLLTRAG